MCVWIIYRYKKRKLTYKFSFPPTGNSGYDLILVFWGLF